MATDKDFEQRVGRVEELIARIEESPDGALRANARELVQTLLDLHRVGLEKVFGALATSEAGIATAIKTSADPLVASLLMLHDIHPISLEQRVRAALDKVRPYLKSHGGGVTLLGIERGKVELRLEGSCNGCPSSSVTMKLAVEDAILELAPDVAEIKVEGVVPPTKAPEGLVQLRSVSKKAIAEATPTAGQWEEVYGLPEADGSVIARDVQGQSLLLLRVGDAVYAYRDACPCCGKQLGATSTVSGEVECRQCSASFDVKRAGRSLAKPNVHLTPLPLLVDGPRARIALPATSAPREVVATV